MTDGSGKVVESYRYDTFGNIILGFQRNSGKQSTLAGAKNEQRNTAESKMWLKNDRLYTSREYDEELGMYYYRGRHYDPRIGRFIQRDPIGMSDDVNLYRYVGNNPMNYVDPFGLNKCKTAVLDLSVLKVDRVPFILKGENEKYDNSEYAYNVAAFTYNVYATIWDGLVGTVEYAADVVDRSVAYQENYYIPPVFSSAAVIGGDLYDVGSSVVNWAKGTSTDQKLAQAYVAVTNIDNYVNATAFAVTWKGLSSSKAGVVAETTNVGSKIDKVADVVSDANKALIDAGKKIDRNRITQAGRALQKHGDRKVTIFPKVNLKVANKIGQEILESIINSENKIIKNNRFGGKDIYDAITGRGARYDGNGKLMGFLEP